MPCSVSMPRDFVANVDRFLAIGAKKGEICVSFRADDGDTYQVRRTVGGQSLAAGKAGGRFL